MLLMWLTGSAEIFGHAQEGMFLRLWDVRPADEILLTLSIAGAGAYVYSPWVALAVVVVMLTVVASYRQNVHAYPSGGGDYEVATVNLGSRAGTTVASALLVPSSTCTMPKKPRGLRLAMVS